MTNAHSPEGWLQNFGSLIIQHLYDVVGAWLQEFHCILFIMMSS